MKPLLMMLFLCLALAGTSMVCAADIPRELSTYTITQLDLSVPESPAFTVLGIAPETVTRPALLRALVTSLLSGIDQTGHLQSGVALDFAPYLLTSEGRNLQIKDYAEKSAWDTRLLVNTEVSFATTKGAGSEDNATRLALGLHLMPYAGGDPRQDKELVDAAGTVGDELAADTITADEAASSWRTTLDNYIKRVQWKPSVIVAGAPAWITPDGTTNHLRSDGYGVWASVAFGSLASNRLILHGRLRENEDIADPSAEGTFVKQDTKLLGLRYCFLGNDTGLSLEGAYTWQNRAGHPKDEFTRFGIVLEQRLRSDLWLGFLVGAETGRRDGNDLRFDASFKWGFSGDRQLK